MWNPGNRIEVNKLTIALVRVSGDCEVGAEAVLLAVIRVRCLHFELLQNSVIL